MFQGGESDPILPAFLAELGAVFQRTGLVGRLLEIAVWGVRGGLMPRVFWLGLRGRSGDVSGERILWEMGCAGLSYYYAA